MSARFYEAPMTKREAQAFLRRAREGLRDAEQALRDGNTDDLREALGEVVGSAVHVQEAVEEDHEGDSRGIRGVA